MASAGGGPQTDSGSSPGIRYTAKSKFSTSVVGTWVRLILFTEIL